LFSLAAQKEAKDYENEIPPYYDIFITDIWRIPDANIAEQALIGTLPQKKICKRSVSFWMSRGLIIADHG